MVKRSVVKQPSTVCEPFIRVGDAVRLLYELQPIIVVDAITYKEHFIAETHVHVFPAKKQEYRLFDSVAGIFMGTDYLSLNDRRAPNGISQRLKYKFMFGSNMVFINPNAVEVIAKYADILEEKESE